MVQFNSMLITIEGFHYLGSTPFCKNYSTVLRMKRLKICCLNTRFLASLNSNNLGMSGKLKRFCFQHGDKIPQAIKYLYGACISIDHILQKSTKEQISGGLGSDRDMINYATLNML